MNGDEHMAKKDDMTEEELNARHAEKMAKKKAARDKILATKTIEKGLVIVHTGKGKGKSTAAMGLAVRAIGNGMKVGMVQFVKGKWETGERKVLEHFPDLCVMKAMGEGFSWETQDRARDIDAARQAWEAAKEMINDPSFKVVILDELNIVLRYENLPLDEVIETLQAKPDMLHVVVTGRNAKDELIEIADLVTEMTQIKHPFRSGVKAQVGIGLHKFVQFIPDAKAVMIFPSVIKAGLFFGGEAGNGLLMARTADGGWSAPAFYTMGAGSFGLQIGAQDTEIILIIRNQGALAAVLKDQAKIGADAGVTAGIYGVGAEASTTTNLGVDVLAFANSKLGGYIGASVEGAIIARRQDLNEAIYGVGMTPDKIVSDPSAQMARAERLKNVLGN